MQFTAKQLNRQAAKAGKDEQTEKAKLKKVEGSFVILFPACTAPSLTHLLQRTSRQSNKATATSRAYMHKTRSASKMRS